MFYSKEKPLKYSYENCNNNFAKTVMTTKYFTVNREEKPLKYSYENCINNFNYKKTVMNTSLLFKIKTV